MRSAGWLARATVAVTFVCLGLSRSSGEVVTLQQGVDDYAGCTTRVIQNLQPATGTPGADQGIFPLLGSARDLQIKFELPAELVNKRLARARLFVFLPAAYDMNTFLEIFCHEVTTAGRQPGIDEATDYDNGRRPGAVDSVELFAPPHEGWPDFPFLPRGVPTEGKWIAFNITPLAERWLKNPAANHGVLLMPADCPDKRRPSTWRIDIPTEGFSDPTIRPRLEMEFAPLPDEVLLAMTTPLRQISSRSTRYDFRGQYQREYHMSMAGGEYEALQVVIYPMLRDLRNVRLRWTNMATEDGQTIPGSHVEYFLEDWYTLRRNWLTSGVFYAGKLYDVPDPLLPARPTLARQHMHTPLYVRIHTDEATFPGDYRGKITLEADGCQPQEMVLYVHVWPFVLPRQWNFHTLGQLVWENVLRFHDVQPGTQAERDLLGRYQNFLLDHRISPTEQYRRFLSPRDNLAHCLGRGMNTIYLSGNFTGTDSEMRQLRKNYKLVQGLRALDYALVYVGDETDQYDEMRRRANLVHAHLPGVQVMVGGSLPREQLAGAIDIYDPQIAGDSKVYSLQQDSADLIAASQRRGEQFYWYVAAGPTYPGPNVTVEYPLIDARTLFWMTWKYRVTGFEYYCYNIWERNYSNNRESRYPRCVWNADGWSQGWPSNGDGMLFYPGPITSLRLEAVRDGIEDWEMHLYLQDCITALRHNARDDKYSELLSRADAILEVDRSIVAGFDRLTRSPKRLLAARDAVGQTIAEVLTALEEQAAADPKAWTYEDAAQDRRMREVTLRRQMLHERHIRACKALGMKALSDKQWQGLWPAPATRPVASRPTRIAATRPADSQPVGELERGVEGED